MLILFLKLCHLSLVTTQIVGSTLKSPTSTFRRIEAVNGFKNQLKTSLPVFSPLYDRYTESSTMPLTQNTIRSDDRRCTVGAKQSFPRGHTRLTHIHHKHHHHDQQLNVISVHFSLAWEQRKSFFAFRIIFLTSTQTTGLLQVIYKTLHARHDIMPMTHAQISLPVEDHGSVYLLDFPRKQPKCLPELNAQGSHTPHESLLTTQLSDIYTGCQFSEGSETAKNRNPQTPTRCNQVLARQPGK